MAASYPAMAPITAHDLLKQARTLLLDPLTGPVVPSPNGVAGAERLADVRIIGKPSPEGTNKWVPGESGYPFAVLDLFRGKKTYPVTGQLWADYTGYMYLALTNEDDGLSDYKGWALDWDAVLDQWFPLFRGLGAISAGQALGDCWWRYDDFEARPFYLAGVALYGALIQFTLHNVVSVTQRVGAVNASLGMLGNLS